MSTANRTAANGAAPGSPGSASHSPATRACASGSKPRAARCARARGWAGAETSERGPPVTGHARWGTNAMSKFGFCNRRALCALSLCLAWMAHHPERLQAKCKPGVALTAGDHNYDMMFGGMTRTFLLHVPTGYTGKKPVPLVFDLHGSGSTGPSELASSRFSA